VQCSVSLAGTDMFLTIAILQGVLVYSAVQGEAAPQMQLADFQDLINLAQVNSPPDGGRLGRSQFKGFGGFGQQTQGFGQPTKQGVGQPTQRFGQPTQGFGQLSNPGFGQPTNQGFGQAVHQGFGQAANTIGKFGSFGQLNKFGQTVSADSRKFVPASFSADGQHLLGGQDRRGFGDRTQQVQGVQQVQQAGHRQLGGARFNQAIGRVLPQSIFLSQHSPSPSPSASRQHNPSASVIPASTSTSRQHDPAVHVQAVPTKQTVLQAVQAVPVTQAVHAVHHAVQEPVRGVHLAVQEPLHAVHHAVQEPVQGLPQQFEHFGNRVHTPSSTAHKHRHHVQHEPVVQHVQHAPVVQHVQHVPDIHAAHVQEDLYDVVQDFNPNRARASAIGRERVNLLEASAAAEERCIEKIEQVEEIEYDTVDHCEHSYEKKCHTSYTTEYTTNQEEDCEETFKKECDITYSPSAQNVTVQVCSNPLIKDCNLSGPLECRTEYVAECWSKDEEHTVLDDVAECQTVNEEKCEEEVSGYTTREKCTSWPREVCTVNKQLKRKSTPNTKCEKVPQELCGPPGCGFVSGPEVCLERTKTIVTRLPSESCNLHPQTRCESVTKLVPKLVPVEECVDVPKEVCSKVRGPGRSVLKPITKTWCYTPTLESGLI
jgi:hypothetical protein